MDKLLESGLNRLNQHLENGEAMAIVSAFRSDNSLSTNRENTEKLRKLALTAGFGYAKVVGGYVEEVDGKKIPVEEDSTIIYAPKGLERSLLTFAMGMGIKFKQDSILWVSSKGEAQWIATRNDSTIGKINSRLKLGNFNVTDTQKYYTKIGKKKFIFKSLDEQAPRRPTFSEFVCFENLRESLDHGDYEKFASLVK